MKRSLLGFLRHRSLINVFITGAFITASSAYCASYSSTLSTPSGTYFGVSGVDLPYTPDNGSVTASSSLTLIDLGILQEATPNGNVTATSSATLNISISLPGLSSPVSFTASLATDPKFSQEEDIDFTAANSFLWTGEPTGATSPATFDVQNVGSCSFGSSDCYSVGVESIQINPKATTIWAFVGPAIITPAPEPIPAATTGLATLGLLAFALRRKFKNQVS